MRSKDYHGHGKEGGRSRWFQFPGWRPGDVLGWRRELVTRNNAYKWQNLVVSYHVLCPSKDFLPKSLFLTNLDFVFIPNFPLLRIENAAKYGRSSRALGLGRGCATLFSRESLLNVGNWLELSWSRAILDTVYTYMIRIYVIYIMYIPHFPLQW